MLPYSVYNSLDLLTDLSRHNYKKLLKEIFPECVYCGDEENLTIDHVVPKSKGGSNLINNLVMCCPQCNLSKSNKDLDHWYPKQPCFEEWRMEMVNQWVQTEYKLNNVKI